MAKALTKQERPKFPTPFNLRMQQAYDYAKTHFKMTQKKLGEMSGCGQQNIQKLLTRAAESSAYTVQIAVACRVSPYWLAIGGDEEMLRPDDIPDDALAVGVAWAHLKPSLRDAPTKELLENGLTFVPTTHPMYKRMERLFHGASKGVKRQQELKGL